MPSSKPVPEVWPGRFPTLCWRCHGQLQVPGGGRERTSPPSPSQTRCGSRGWRWPPLSSPATGHPRQPQTSPGLTSGAALEPALLCPRELCIACIPASLRNPSSWKNTPLTTILFCRTYKTTKTEEGTKKERRHRRCPPAPSALVLRPAVLSGFCPSHAALVALDPSTPQSHRRPRRGHGCGAGPRRPPVPCPPLQEGGPEPRPSARSQLREGSSDLAEHWGL